MGMLLVRNMGVLLGEIWVCCWEKYGCVVDEKYGCVVGLQNVYEPALRARRIHSGPRLLLLPDFGLAWTGKPLVLHFVHFAFHSVQVYFETF